MSDSLVEQVRRFNRVVTKNIGALDLDYLGRKRPLAESRLLFEIGASGASVHALRVRLEFDSGYLSRLLRGLEGEGLVATVPAPGDRRARTAVLTEKGLGELQALDRMSDERARSLIDPLDQKQRDRLARAMSEVERLLSSSAVRVCHELPTGADAQWCLACYYAELETRFPSGFTPDYEDAPSLDEFIAPLGCFLVMRLDGEPVGCGALKKLDAERAYIKRMWISPSARGLGLGRRLLGALELEARALGYGFVCLETHASLEEAQQLYRSAGYAEVAPFNAEPYAHHWFEKQLPA